VAAVAAVALVVAGACSSSSKGSPTATSAAASPRTTAGGPATTAAAVQRSPITIGFITSDTGLAASSYVDSEWGAQARIDALNDAGGVNGHKIVLKTVDDGSSFANNLTLAQDLVENKGAFGLIEDSTFVAGAYKWLNQQGVPVTGAAIDGPEWNTPPNTNMFSVFPVFGPFPNGARYTNDNGARFLKDIGVTKLALLAYNIPSAIAAAKADVVVDQQQGIQNCYLNTTIPFNDQDFTAIALQIKSAGCDGVEGLFLLGSDIPLSRAVKAAGVTAKFVYPTAYDQNLLDQQSALQAMLGDYTSTTVDFSVNPSPAAKLMLARLKQYTKFTGGIPSINVVYGYAAADLMITGLQRAGVDPTRAGFISNLRTYDGWDGEGLFSQPTILSHFGTTAMVSPTGCALYVQISSSGFVQYGDGKPICGNNVATS
jgi:branched-chain amino acid transport system substrate-binding protein